MTRLSRHDVKGISLYDEQCTDAKFTELLDCLLAHPNVFEYVWLAHNKLTDETGVTLARCVAVSSTINWLSLAYNQFNEATYLAIAAALRVNTSLRELYFIENQAVNQNRIDASFVEALQLNPDRPAMSCWYLYSTKQNDFDRLQRAADTLGAPSLLAQLDFAEEK